MNSLEIYTKVLLQNLNLKKDESILILTDEHLFDIANKFYQAAKKITQSYYLFSMPVANKSGEEPPEIVNSVMKKVDVVLAITSHSITHTLARKEACNLGARVATMPGISNEMLASGGLHAEMLDIVRDVEFFKNKLDVAEQISLIKDQHTLTFSIKGRQGISSTGLVTEKGSYGNIPSGEAYIAPIENSANGEILIDGSIANIGVLQEPLLLKIENGILVDAIGLDGQNLLSLLGDESGRTIAEFGIGANSAAQICGNILEDEKVKGTVHIAFGSNITFGGINQSSVHIDCVIKKPTLQIDTIVTPL